MPAKPDCAECDKVMICVAKGWSPVYADDGYWYGLPRLTRMFMTILQPMCHGQEAGHVDDSEDREV